jgi:hypothetical protein
VTGAIDIAARLAEALDPLITDVTEVVLEMDARFERDRDLQVSRWREKLVELLSVAMHARREAAHVAMLKWLEAQAEDETEEGEDDVADADSES